MFYGSGAGPVPGNEALTPTPENLTNIPIEVDIGGLPAMVAYHGRANYPGLDQINVEVPTGVSGCRVSLAVVSSGLVSNIDFIPVAQSGRTCSDQVPGVVVPSAVTVSGKSTVKTGMINLNRAVLMSPPITIGSSTCAECHLGRRGRSIPAANLFGRPGMLKSAGTL